MDPYVRKLEDRAYILKEGILAVADLINESNGVAGLHLNGDIAPWDDLLEDGRWLEDFTIALELLKEN